MTTANLLHRNSSHTPAVQNRRVWTWQCWPLVAFVFGLGKGRPPKERLVIKSTKSPSSVTIRTPKRSAHRAFQMGCAYLHGAGVPASIPEGIRWLRLAGCNGHGEAQALLAKFCLRGIVGAGQLDCDQRSQSIFREADLSAEPDYTGAEYWARLASGNGSPDGHAVLAHILASGPFALRCLPQAEALLERSALAGCPQGMIGYALTLDRKSDDARARQRIVNYVQRAADAGLPTAHYLLGNLHERGTGVPHDLALAVQCYRRAAEDGHVRAQALWGTALLHGKGVPADRLEGEAWLRQVALAGDDGAWEQLAGIVRGGASGAGDPVDTCRWFERMATRGNLTACFYHGVCLAIGAGTERNEPEAAHWLFLAAAELPKAQYWYGRMLIEGRGMDRDRAQGRIWIERAAANGLSEAISALSELGPVNATLDERALVSQTPDARPAGVIADIQLEVSKDHQGTHDERMAGDPLVDPQPKVTFAVKQASQRPLEGRSSMHPAVKLPQIDETQGTCGCGSGLRPVRCCNLDPAYAAEPGTASATQSKAQHAMAALIEGDETTALRLCLEALELAPRLPLALWTLYLIRTKSGLGQTARKLLQRLVTLEPDNARWTQEFALQCFKSGEFATAEQHARNAVRLAPLDPTSHDLMGMILTETQQLNGAEFHYRRVFELATRQDPILLANLAWNLKCQGRLAEARGLYQSSFAAAPDVFQTLFGWAQLEEADRNFGAANDLLDKAAKLRPGDITVSMARASIAARDGRPGIALEGIERLAAQPANGTAQASESRSDILLLRGRLLDQLQRHDEAFACFLEAKRILREASGKSYAGSEACDVAGRLKRLFVSEHVRLMQPARVRSDIAQPVFILGFPRSGTTLVEQILSGHPAVAAGDELPFVNEIVAAAPRLLGSSLAYPEALADLWMGDNRLGADFLRDVYLQKAASRKLTDQGNEWFTDKMPLNEFHLGLIALIFPKSPLLHIVRHPLDVVVSAFSHAMTHGYSCTNSLEGVARHYVLVMDLVQHYRQHLDIRYLELRYEDLIGDFEAGVRKILEFAGLPFDDRCIQFHLNRRVPQTPSCAQVSEKLYERSRYRYRKYLKHLDPVLPILAPTIERMGFTVY